MSYLELWWRKHWSAAHLAILPPQGKSDALYRPCQGCSTHYATAQEDPALCPSPSLNLWGKSASTPPMLGLLPGNASSLYLSALLPPAFTPLYLGKVRCLFLTADYSQCLGLPKLKASDSFLSPECQLKVRRQEHNSKSQMTHDQ